MTEAAMDVRRSQAGALAWLLRAAGLGALVLVGAWLRWQYVVTISPYIDEFTTMWAAEQVLKHGVPVMPSGVLYTRGLLDSYLTALFVAVGGDSFTVGRLPSLLFGLATVPLVWWIGKKGWAELVGWLAALGLALLPEAIVWSGRARFYAPLQTFALLTVWSGYQSAREAEATWRAQLTFALMFILALFMQEETVLLYPAAVLGVLLWRGRKAFTEPPVIVSHLLCLAAMGVRYLIEILGQPGYFETIQAERPYVGLFGDVAGTWRVYAPLFLDVERIVFTVGTLVAVVVAVLPRVVRAKSLPALAAGPGGSTPKTNGAGVSGDVWVEPGADSVAATQYFALMLFSVVAIILFFVGETWRDARYLYFVQPLWLLLGAAGVWELARRLRWPTTRAALYAGIALVAGALLWGPARATLEDQQEGYDLALAYLAGEREAGDAVLTPQPPACAFMLEGPCDYYAIQRGYEEYVIRRDGVLIDRWTGIPLLNETSELERVIREAPRTWMATDGLRLATRYEVGFLRTLVEQFDVVHDTRGVAVLRADGWQEIPPPAAIENFVEPQEFSPLHLDRWARSEAHPGEPLRVAMTWHGEGWIDRQYQTFVHLIDERGERVAQDDGPPAKGMIPTVLFGETPLPDIKEMELPEDLREGWYRIDAGVYEEGTLAPVGSPVTLDWVRVGEPELVMEGHGGEVWANGLYLERHGQLPTGIVPGRDYHVTLNWSAQRPIDDPALTVFVHLVAADGTIVVQADRAPLGGFFPASEWDAGDIVEDRYTLTTPAELPPGPYTLQVGWYSPADSSRVPLANGGDASTLATFP